MLPGHSEINTLKFHDTSNSDIMSKHPNKNVHALRPFNRPSCGNIQW